MMRTGLAMLLLSSSLGLSACSADSMGPVRTAGAGAGGDAGTMGEAGRGPPG